MFLDFKFITTQRGSKLLYLNGYKYTPNQKDVPHQKRKDYKCSMYHRLKCKARAIITGIPEQVKIRGFHNHHPDETVFKPKIIQNFQYKFLHS